MIEQGLVRLIQGDAAVAKLSPEGGFFEELPKDHSLPSWTYSVTDIEPLYIHGGTSGLNSVLLGIESYGSESPNGQAEAINLATAIDAVINNFSGELPDPDATAVLGVFASPGSQDFFDDVRRNYRRLRTYLIWFRISS